MHAATNPRCPAGIFSHMYPGDESRKNAVGPSIDIVRNNIYTRLLFCQVDAVEDEMMAELIKLGQFGKSVRGNKYRSMICTTSRNDIHLREFVVRHILVGFAHIVIYDNNQVRSKREQSAGERKAQGCEG